MTVYRYQTNVFIDGRLSFQETKQMDGVMLECNAGKKSREAFLELINRWNKQGLYNVAEHGRIYVYIAL
jgi:hypothetical protein